MSIVSIQFLLFVLAVALIYYIVPKKFRWTVLLTGSYVFYWMNSEWLVFILLATSLMTYLFGLLLQRVSDRNRDYLNSHKDLAREEKKALKEKQKKQSRRILRVGILLVLGALLYLKYFNFFGENLNTLFASLGTDWSVAYLNLLLPLGISFYTLQAISYLVDVYRGKVQADRNPAKFLLYMSFFPQILQGPIPRYKQLANQLYEGHALDYDQLRFGAQRIIWGFFKKLVIAERVAIPVSYLMDNYTQYSGPVVFFGIVLYSVQIYADFSGGMDIACGVAQMFGIKLESNFEQPYLSNSIEDFWRRWHITMGSWMKDYIFYPLSLSKSFGNIGKKCSKCLGSYIGNRIPVIIAMFIVYLAVGFWHGANWTYIVYGIWNGLFIMISILLEDVYVKAREICRIDDRTITWRVFRIVRTFIIISFGRFFSRAPSMEVTLSLFTQTFINWRDISFLSNGTLLEFGLDNANWFILILFVLLLIFVDLKHENGVSFRNVIARQHLVFRWIIYIAAILSILIFGIYGPEYNAASFIYGQF